MGHRHPLRRRNAAGLLLASSVAVLALPVAIAPPPAAAQAAGPQQGVVIRGNRRIEAETILAYMMLQPGQRVDAATLNLAVRRLFDTGLFRDVRIIPSEGSLIVEVDENPVINVIAFEGNDALTDEDLTQIIALRPRLPFTPASAEADAQAIIEVYRRTGRYGAEVSPSVIERSDNRVDLVFEIREGQRTGVAAIDFVGNEVFSDRRLRNVVDTSETGFLSRFFSGDIYDPDRLELDKELLRQFYLSRGHADFAVLSASSELSPERDGFFITFTVEEGPVYTFGEFDVVVNEEGLDPEEFRAIVPADLTGETYDSTQVDEIANALTDLAGEKGFAFVQVRPRAVRDPEAQTIGVVFELVEGPRVFIERIDIEGNQQTLDRVIRRQVQLVEGDAFDARRIRDTRNRVRRLGFFRDVQVETVQGSAEDRAVLKVQVTEQSTGSLSFGIGFSTSSGPLGNVAITERNFLGRGQTLQFQLTAAGDTQIYDLGFTEPYFLDRDLAVGFRAFFIDEDRDDESSFELVRAGFQPQVGFPLSEDARIRLRYAFQRDDLDVSSDASSAVAVDEGVNFRSGVGYFLTYDKRNDPLEPTAGYYATLDQEVTGLGGDSRYIKSRGTIKGWTSFFDEDVVASIELEAGALFTFGQDSRIDERFFIGGQTMRGFAREGIGPRDLTTDDALGGNYFGVARFEVTFPLGLPDELGIYGGAFVDAGTLFGLDRTDFPAIGTSPATSIDDGAQFRVAAGGLLFVDTPFGPLELSFGFPVIDEEFDESELFRLSVGTRF